MNREQYLTKMQELREEQQSNAKKNREILDTLNKEHVEKQRIENDNYRVLVNSQRDKHTAMQHDVERRMNDLKLQWAKEHPIEEVKIID